MTFIRHRDLDGPRRPWARWGGGWYSNDPEGRWQKRQDGLLGFVFLALLGLAIAGLGALVSLIAGLL